MLLQWIDIKKNVTFAPKIERRCFLFINKNIFAQNAMRYFSLSERVMADIALIR